MRRAIALLSLLLFLLAGCDTEEDPADILPDSSGELTDGFCLVSGGQVLYTHSDINYYDFGAHLVYLKPPVTTSILMTVDELSVYAGGEEIYSLTTQPGSASPEPEEPLIYADLVSYAENILPIAWLQSYEEMQADDDPREDPRIVDALTNYEQYREGLQCEILSVHYVSAQEVVVELKLYNGDPVNYYYLDPGRMGPGLFHFFTSGLLVWDEDRNKTYESREDGVEPEQWDSWDPAWLSLLESGASDTLSIEYNRFQVVPPGTYPVFFTFPGLSYQVDWEDLEQPNGRIWLGELKLQSEVLVEEDWGI